MKFKIYIFILFWGMLNPAYSSSHQCLSLGKEALRFLKSMPGEWKGHAPKTPLGKLPYDLTFESKKENVVEGISKTNGQAIHTWKFSFSKGILKLDFHSTFGDSHAKGLCATKYSNKKGYFFSNGEPNFLQLWINIKKEKFKLNWKVEIFLRNEQHVLINAEKASP